MPEQRDEDTTQRLGVARQQPDHQEIVDRAGAGFDGVAAFLLQQGWMASRLCACPAPAASTVPVAQAPAPMAERAS